MKPRWTAAIAALLALHTSGCGSGGGGQTALCDLDAFTPSYARQTSHLFNWDGFPITVHFVRNAEFSDARRSLALAGFDQWVAASGGKLNYSEVESPTGADVTVRFDPSNDDGLTTSYFHGLEVNRAEMLIGVKDQLAPDLQCVAAHEFGHVLGIDGHSDNPSDLMYPTHFSGSACALTDRDVNTMKTAYCNLFGRSALRASRSSEGPSGSVTIR